MLEGMTPPKPKGLTCKVKVIATDLSESDRKIFLEAVADTELWAGKSLARELRARGIDISDSSINRHRNKDCQCSKG